MRCACRQGKNDLYNGRADSGCAGALRVFRSIGAECSSPACLLGGGRGEGGMGGGLVRVWIECGLGRGKG